jgi:hypothetical protein
MPIISEEINILLLIIFVFSPLFSFLTILNLQTENFKNFITFGVLAILTYVAFGATLFYRFGLIALIGLSIAIIVHVLFLKLHDQKIKFIYLYVFTIINWTIGFIISCFLNQV